MGRKVISTSYSSTIFNVLPLFLHFKLINKFNLLVLEGLLQRQGVVVAQHRDKETGRSSGKYSLV